MTETISLKHNSYTFEQIVGDKTAWAVCKTADVADADGLAQVLRDKGISSAASVIMGDENNLLAPGVPIVRVDENEFEKLRAIKEDLAIRLLPAKKGWSLGNNQ